MKIYQTIYHTRQFIVTVVRDSEIVNICIYDKTGEDWVTLAEAAYHNVSDLQALKNTRNKFKLY